MICFLLQPPSLTRNKTKRKSPEAIKLELLASIIEMAHENFPG